MRHIPLLLVLLLFSAKSAAHPSYGIVVTKDGSLIFCDVLHHEGAISKLDPSGKLTTLLTYEHCHFIFMDHRGAVWGTNHEYLPSTDSNRNTLWKLNADGEKEIIIEPTEDRSAFTGVNFVVDRKGMIYFDYENKLYIRNGEGGVELFLDHEFERIMALQMDDQENIYVVDTQAQNGAIFKITPAKVRTLVANELKETTPANPPFPEPRFNMLYSAFIDADRTVYVANSGSRRITKIGQDQLVEHIYHSTEPWYPVAYTRNEDIGYVMEMGYISGVGNIGPRIVKMENGKTVELLNVDEDKLKALDSPRTDSPKKVRSPRKNKLLFIFLGVILVGGTILGFWRKY